MMINMNYFQYSSHFFQFLRQDLAISDDSLDLVRKYSDLNEENLPMLLWQYGLISLAQLDSIFDWLEQKR